MMPYMIVAAQGSDLDEEWIRQGSAAHVGGNLPLAQQHYSQALRVNPRHAIATMNMAILFAQTNQLNEALLTIERAAILDPTLGVIAMNWAYMALESERSALAIEQAQRAVAIAPESMESKLCLVSALTSAGRAAEAIPIYDEMLRIDPKHPAAGPNSCFVMTLTDATPADLLIARRRWYEANRFTGAKLPHDNTRDAARPLRVGYVGGDFKSHSAAFIFGRVVLNHDHATVLPYLYCSLPVDPKADARTTQFQAAAGERWRDISALDDAAVDAMIRRDRIDILVDLAGHTNGGRLALFTRKPAPIQVTAWGFAHGTGLPEIDYFFADPVAIPTEERQHFAETIWDLPSIVTMDKVPYDLKAVSRLPQRSNDYITFGSYARYEKFSDKCLATMAEILRRVPDSRLQFKDNAYRRPDAIRRIMAAMPDIESKRLLFSIQTSHADHMLAFQQADLMLDPFPHGGGVVMLEQLYMGVPCVTLFGTQPSGRTGASVLTAMGKQDWIAHSHAEYVEIAVRMAGDFTMLRKERETLRETLLESPVVKGYREAVELAYRGMFAKWCA